MGSVNAIGLVNPKVVELVTAFQARYRDALQAKVDPWWKTVSGFSPTDAMLLKFPIRLGSMPGFREWVGDRDGKNIDVTSFFIESKPWERTIDVPLDVALSGQYAAYLNEVDDLRVAAMIHPNRIIAGLLANGDAVDCWDGQGFFDTGHPVDFRGGNALTYDNAKTSRPFNRANLAYAKSLFRGYKAPDGKTSLGLRLTHVLVPTALEDMATRLSTSEYLPNIDPTASAQAGVTESNIHRGTFTPIIAPELDADSDTTWYALALNLAARPFESQARGAWDDPDIKILGDGSEHATQTNSIRYAGKLFGNSGYAIPHTIIRMKAT
jgi:phage major head subunit gpT-like protein